MTTTGMATPRATFAVVESPALLEGEVSAESTYEALAPLMLNKRL